MPSFSNCLKSRVCQELRQIIRQILQKCSALHQGLPALFASSDKNLLSSCASALFLDSLFATLGHAQRYTAALHRQTVVLSSNQTALGQPARPRADPRRKSSIFAARYDIRIPFFRRKVNAAGPNLPLGIKNESFALFLPQREDLSVCLHKPGILRPGAGGWRRDVV